MATITLEFNAKSKKAQQLISFLKTIDYINVKEKGGSDYDPEFVERIRKTEKEKSHKVDLSKYGINV